MAAEALIVEDAYQRGYADAIADMRKKKEQRRQREQADEAAQWQQGDTVELLGRYQSRQYEKVLDAATGEREQRTAYEVSVRLIRRKEEAENEC